MPRSPGQSDFVFQPNRPAEPAVIELPASTQPVELRHEEPDPELASPGATRVVMTITWLVLAALALLCAIGPHIPTGE